MNIARVWQVGLLNTHGYVPRDAAEAQTICDGMGFLTGPAECEDIPLRPDAKITVIEPVDIDAGAWHVTLPAAAEDVLEECGWMQMTGHTGSVEGEMP